jgi:hypothetical protein
LKYFPAYVVSEILRLRAAPTTPASNHRKHSDEAPKRERGSAARNARAGAKKRAGVDDTRTLSHLRGRKSRQRQARGAKA